eukprot:scaffold135513_cov42-Prasinocladus_malaysianus.AAC.1
MCPSTSGNPALDTLQSLELQRLATRLALGVDPLIGVDLASCEGPEAASGGQNMQGKGIYGKPQASNNIPSIYNPAFKLSTPNCMFGTF